MYIPDIIKKKRDNKKLTKQDISYLIDGYVKNEIPDYQMSAFLMAAFLRGLDYNEMLYLTESMMNSGYVYDLSDIEGIKVDKHSTGGVGDKVSIALAPILCALGFYVPMVSGRGLGHTGGTLDKLESIKGFNVYLDKYTFKKILKQNGVVMCGQTDNFVPADKKLYALRDVTGTVESIPLITASIMSKKLAEGVDCLVLDIKQGSGAFMKTFEQAEILAESMYEIGKRFNKKVSYLISDMSNVLGDTAGNGIEILESIEILKNSNKNDVYQLIKEIVSIIMLKNNIVDNKEQAYKKVEKVVQSGYAYEKFEKMIKLQNGDLNYLKKEKLVSSKSIEIKVHRDGYINSIDVYKIGIALIYLKAGRFKKEDKINHLTGIRVYKKTGDKVQKGETLFTVYYDNDYRDSEKLLKESIIINDIKPENLKLIKKVKI